MDEHKSVTLELGFQPEPQNRGTIGILVPCLAVLVLNVWTLFHVDIPPKGESTHLFWLHRVKIWIITLIVPDGVATLAVSQWRDAKRHVTDMRKVDSYGWWTLKHAFYAEMGGYRVRDSSGQECAFRSAELYELVRERMIVLPEISLEDLDDRSDADGFVKGLALLQSIYFLAMAFSDSVKKPVNIQCRTLVECPELDHNALATIAMELSKPANYNSNSYWWRPVPRELHQLGWDFFWFESRFDFSTWKAKVPPIPPTIVDLVQGSPAHTRITDWYLPSVKEMHPSQWGWEEDAMIFGLGLFVNCLLLVSWKSTFPSEIESLLWKCSVFAMLITTTIWWPIAWLASYSFDSRSLAKHTFFYKLIGVYMLGRAYVLVEPFLGLRALPLSAYQTVSWSRYIPHFQ